MERFPIGIIGGGIWGLSAAFQLADLGHGRDVIVLERNRKLASETTPQSAGQIGQLRGDPILARAVGDTLAVLGDFAASTGYDPGFVRSGSVHLALTPARVNQFSQLTAAAAGSGLPVSLIDAGEAVRLVPALAGDRVLAALHVPNDGYVDAARCALAFAAAAAERGVTLRCDAAVHQIVPQQNGRIRLETPAGPIEVERLVVTAGPWTGQLAAQLGIPLGMHPIRLQQARTVADRVPARHPVVRFPDESCYVRPEQEGYLFGFFDPHPRAIDLDQQGADFRTDSVRPEMALIEEARRRLRPVLPRLGELPVDTYRQGMMTCTPDGKFVLGPAPGARHIWLATGCGGTGIAACGAVGRWIARGIMAQDPGADLSQYALDRFGPQVADRQWLREQACATSAAYYRLPSATA